MLNFSTRYTDFELITVFNNVHVAMCFAIMRSKTQCYYMQSAALSYLYIFIFTLKELLVLSFNYLLFIGENILVQRT